MIVLRRSYVSGDVPLVEGFSDISKKTHDELGMVNVDWCSRCKMAHYCSTACRQTKQWRAGHTYACQNESEIQVGDVIRIRAESCGATPIVVTRAVPDKTDVWEVNPLDCSMRPKDVVGSVMSTFELAPSHEPTEKQCPKDVVGSVMDAFELAPSHESTVKQCPCQSYLQKKAS